MTLAELVESLPVNHRAREEYAALAAPLRHQADPFELSRSIANVIKLLQSKAFRSHAENAQLAMLSQWLKMAFDAQVRTRTAMHALHGLAHDTESRADQLRAQAKEVFETLTVRVM